MAFFEGDKKLEKKGEIDHHSSYKLQEKFKKAA